MYLVEILDLNVCLLPINSLFIISHRYVPFHMASKEIVLFWLESKGRTISQDMMRIDQCYTMSIRSRGQYVLLA